MLLGIERRQRSTGLFDKSWQRSVSLAKICSRIVSGIAGNQGDVDRRFGGNGIDDQRLAQMRNPATALDARQIPLEADDGQARRGGVGVLNGDVLQAVFDDQANGLAVVRRRVAERGD